MAPSIYIAGPMTGLPEYNFPAFHAAADAWRAVGWDVFNPAESFEGRTDLAYRDYVKVDLAALRRCDAIALLPGWDGANARGSVWEHEVAAELLGIPVYDARCQVPPRARSPLPVGKQERKTRPITSGVLDYFPGALAEVALVSYSSTAQHHPGQPMHWERRKSSDHADCITRHLVERGTVDDDGMRHSAKLAWRALALLQEELEAEGSPPGRASRFAPLPTPTPDRQETTS